MSEQNEENRMQVLRGEIAARLQAVCAEWPQEMFDEMVRGLAAITLKYDLHTGEPSYDRRTTDRLIAEMRSLADKASETRGGWGSSGG